MYPVDPISEPEAVAPLPGPPAHPIAVAPPSELPDRADSVVDLLDATLALAASFFFLIGAATIFSIIAQHTHALKGKALEDAFTHNVFFIVPLQLVVYVATTGFMALLVWARHRTSLPQAIRWNAPDGRRALNAVMVGAALALVSDAGEIVLHRWIPKSLPITDYFHDRPSALLLAGFAVLVAPLMEEIFFRGFLYPGLARWTGAVPSILITASAFTLLHGSQLSFSWAPLLLIFVVGLALTVARATTKSVATCVIIHMAYNFALMAQTFIFTHGFRQLQGD